MRIVVTGMAATFPFGGVFWDYMQYPLGLLQLGHDVLYLEDTGKWCYSPEAGTFVEQGKDNATRLAKNIARHTPELAERWSYRDATDTYYGMTESATAEFCRTANLFINLSASCIMRDEHFAAERVAFIDSDPMYTQHKLVRAAEPDFDPDAEPEIAKAVELIRRHDVFFSFGENVGQPGCLMPQAQIHWNPNRQPIVMDCFTKQRVPIAQRRRVLTTVASWEPREKSIQISGERFGGKASQFERYLDLPGRLGLPVELAISGEYPEKKLSDHGWNPVDALPRSIDPTVYRDYLGHSFAELSVAKHAYVASNSGWFSCRSACYMAMGVPVVVQDTGFRDHIPTGQGVFAFSTADQAIAAVDAILTDPQRHAQAAQDIAHSHFNACDVLQQLVDQAMAGASSVHGGAKR